jgi:hypothetical protein
MSAGEALPTQMMKVLSIRKHLLHGSLPQIESLTRSLNSERVLLLETHSLSECG